MKPLCIDLFCGLGGWAEGFLAEGYDVVGFDNHRHVYGDQRYPGQLVLQDALTLDGRQFRNAAVIVASPPCTEYSYMAMPWSRGKQIAAALLEGVLDFPPCYKGSRTVKELRALFDCCFRIAAEAGVPLVVENVKGAQPWVGRARAHFGSYYLWGDVSSVGGCIVGSNPKFGEGLAAARRSGGKANPDGTEHPQGSLFEIADSKERESGIKAPGQNWSRFIDTGEVSPDWKYQGGIDDGRKVPMNLHEHEKTGKPGRSFQSAAVEGLKVPVYSAPRRNGGKGARLTSPAENERRLVVEGIKQRGSGAEWFDKALDERRKAAGVKVRGVNISKVGSNVAAAQAYRAERLPMLHLGATRNDSRKAASAQIAKIPFPLAQWIAKTFKPVANKHIAQGRRLGYDLASP